MVQELYISFVGKGRLVLMVTSALMGAVGFHGIGIAQESAGQETVPFEIANSDVGFNRVFWANRIVSELPEMGYSTSVEDEIDEKVTEMRKCYADLVEKDPRVQDRVLIKFTIRPNGSVSGVRAESSVLNNKKVESCIGAVIKTVEFQYVRDKEYGHEQLAGQEIAYDFVFQTTAWLVGRWERVDPGMSGDIHKRMVVGFDDNGNCLSESTEVFWFGHQVGSHEYGIPATKRQRSGAYADQDMNGILESTCDWAENASWVVYRDPYWSSGNVLSLNLAGRVYGQTVSSP